MTSWFYRKGFSYLEIIVMSLCVWIGAYFSFSFLSIFIVVAILLFSYYLQLKQLFIIMMFLLSSSLSHEADQNYKMLENSNIQKTQLLLIDDPTLGSFHSQTYAKIISGENKGKRIILRASGEEGNRLINSKVGQILIISGTQKAIELNSWNKSKHLVGQINIKTIHESSQVINLLKLPEAIRGRIVASGEYLDYENRALYLGLTIGEDSGQSLAQKAQFRATGLNHLLAVSGQNISLMFAVFSVFINSFSLKFRFIFVSVLLLIFLVVTRFEPSVLRASVMALMATWAGISGARGSGLRVLACSVIILILVDPFIIYSIAFQLSVLATMGIMVLGENLTNFFKRFIISRKLSEVIAITLSAQIFVAPLILLKFGGISLVSLPVNILANWPASLVMVVGSTLGIFVTSLPDFIASLIMYPINISVGFIGFLASYFSRTGPTIFFGTYLLFVILIICVVIFKYSQNFRLLIPLLTVVFMSILLYRNIDNDNFSQMNFVYIAPEKQYKSFVILNEKLTSKDLDRFLELNISHLDVLIVVDSSWKQSKIVNSFVAVSKPDLVYASSNKYISQVDLVDKEVVFFTAKGPIKVNPEKNKLQIIPINSYTDFGEVIY